jgi:hypothetical protein
MSKPMSKPSSHKALPGLAPRNLLLQNFFSRAFGRRIGAASSILTLCQFPSIAFAADYYVGKDGNDNNSGSISSPWYSIKSSIKNLRAGDTLYIRGGKYYETHIDTFPLNEATQQRRITIRNFQDEEVTISGDIPLDQNEDWQRQGDTNIYVHRPSRPSHFDNLSQQGVPLKLMSDVGDVTSFSGKGQWVRSAENNAIWVIVNGTEKPWMSSISLSDAHNIFSLREGANFITLEGLTIENAYYPVQVYSDGVQLLNLVVRNSYGDAIKVEGWHGVGADWNSENGIVRGCDIYNFGESAIDVTGGDHWSIVDNLIHDAAPTRNDAEIDGGYYTNGIMAKNNSIGLLAEGNSFYDLIVRFGVISLGGNTFYPDKQVITDAVVRKNEFRNISAPYIITFSGSKNSGFFENIISDSTIFESGKLSVTSPEALIQFRNGYCEKKSCRDANSGQDILFESSFNTVFDNEFINNETRYIYKEFEAYGLDNDIGNVIDGNIYPDSAYSFFDGISFARDDLAKLKHYDAHGLDSSKSPPEKLKLEIGVLHTK